MVSLERILCPTDFSETSQEAFQYAQRLAIDSHATILLLHAFEMADFWGSGGAILQLVDRATGFGSNLAERKEQLVAIRPSSETIKIEYLAHGGNAGEVICWVGQERDCDLIVMGTHGRTGAAHLLLGSVAEYVVRHARCPVLTLHAGDVST